MPANAGIELPAGAHRALRAFRRLAQGCACDICHHLGAAFAQSDLFDTTRSLRLYGSFDVMSSLTLRGDALLVQDSGDLYSLSATYGMDNGLYVEGGATKITGQDKVLDIGVGFKF